VLDYFVNLDRRWVFLAIGLAVAVPILTKSVFPERATPQSQVIFDELENLPAGSKVMVVVDYDPGSAPELAPMTTAFLRHCCLKRHKIYLVTLWPTGLPLLDQNIREIIEGEFESSQFKYGDDYVNLGYKPGNEVVIKTMATSLRALFSTDNRGTNLDDMPMTKNLTKVADMDVVLDVSAGYPGGKEWVQYAGTQSQLKLAVGCTGVMAVQMYPYYPDQVFGLLAALKGGAEYEAALGAKYPQYRDPQKTTAIRRMGPQLFAHLLMVGLIVLGNVVHFASRHRGAAR